VKHFFPVSDVSFVVTQLLPQKHAVEIAPLEAGGVGDEAQIVEALFLLPT
jgi:hypothetical protein